MKSKKTLTGLAALLILIFHFYIPFIGTLFKETPLIGQIEYALYRSTYIGVDIFFFVSAYSIAQRKDTKYLPFIKNRLLYIYLPFVLFTIVGFFYGEWEIKRIFEVISGIEFFNHGGGAFLWFFTAIMLLYLIAPLLVKLRQKLGLKALLIFIPVWAATVSVLQFAFGYTTLFVFINRLPIFIIGLYYDEIRSINLKKFTLPAILILLAVGTALMWEYGSKVMLQKPIRDIFYIVSIPYSMAIITLTDYISTKVKFRNLPLEIIGGFTLELYALQMIFGFKLEKEILKATQMDKFLSFLITSLCLMAGAFIISQIKKLIISFIKKQKKETEQ